jgi:predicted NBD/HSP70 family sugar kinase
MAQNTAGHMLWLIRTGRARTRSDLQQLTGLARSTVGQRLDQLIAAGYLHQPGTGEAARGRPPNLLEFDTERRVTLVGHLGATQARIAVLDLAGRALAEERADVRVADGPTPVLDWFGERCTAMLHAIGRPRNDVCGVGLGVPGPVEFGAGQVRQPPLMPGWDGYAIDEHLHKTFDVPVLVDNDANLMALGEQITNHPECPALVLVKVSTGIGAGVVIDGSVYRGIDGGAGDLGHVRLAGYDALCRCGARGCLTAVASGGALAERLTAQGLSTDSSRELLARIAAGEGTATQLARAAGQVLGEVLATVVSLLNPGILVIAGDLAETHYVTGVRESLYQRALPRATRHLTVAISRLGHRAGVLGAHAMVVESIFAPDAIDGRLREGSAR